MQWGAEIVSRITYQSEKMWSYHIAEEQHRGRPEQLVIRIIFTYLTQSTLTRDM